MPHYKLPRHQVQRRHGGAVALPHRPSLMHGGYTCPELKPDPSILPGRLAAFKLPSRVGDRLYWPDGRVTGLDGNKVQS